MIGTLIRSRARNLGVGILGSVYSPRFKHSGDYSEPGIPRPGTQSVTSKIKEQRAMVPPETAFELMHEVGWESRHTYLDVRTPEEFARSRPKGAVNVPLMVKTAKGAPKETGDLGIPTGGLRMLPNLDFVLEVRKEFTLERQLIVGSADKSRRALAAVKLLEENGYTNAIAMMNGHKGWVAADLPMEGDDVDDDDFF
ncbi:hypothetical protein CYMTET_30815 [Cymbomonas tetramitiformis]|uniref:Rhodanese domain-containing protein n=1 Tax=Cymbomonas tetramitiformis TaxID=36881 RepID=A0AAE0FI35_9CHLO|nr:hypothetical protein CYMTET_30815 [Cymbomonas tetramitiformis]